MPCPPQPKPRLPKPHLPTPALPATNTRTNTKARTAAQKTARQSDILHHARSALNEIGYDRLTMAQLARRCGLAKGSLYLYFPSREAVFLCLLADMLDDVCDTICCFQAHSPARISDLLARGFTADPQLLPLMANRAGMLHRTQALDAHDIFLQREHVAQSRLSDHIGRMLRWGEVKASTATQVIMLVLYGYAQTRTKPHKSSGPARPHGNDGLGRFILAALQGL